MINFHDLRMFRLIEHIKNYSKEKIGPYDTYIENSNNPTALKLQKFLYKTDFKVYRQNIDLYFGPPYSKYSFHVWRG